MANLFSLVGEIIVDNKEANEKIEKTGEKAEKTGKSFLGSLGSAAKWAAGVAAGAAAVGAAMVTMATNTAAALDDVAKGSQRMDISTDYYQKLAYTVGQCGIEMTTMEKAAKKLEGTDLNMEGALEQIMALGTEEERSAKAAELFGDTLAYQLSPMLAGSGEDFEALMNRAEDLGLVFSEDAVNAGVVLGDTMSDVKQSLGAIGTSIAIEVMPYVQLMLNWVIEHMPEIKRIVGEAIEFIVRVVKTIWPILKPILNTIGDALEWIIDLIGRIVDGFKNIKMPEIKLPHFAISPRGWTIGDLLKGSIPKLTVEYYAKAMDEPRLLTEPTIFGASGGKLLAGGEAGNELVVGENKMLDMISQANAAQFDALGGYLSAIYELLGEYMPTLTNRQLVLNTGALVGELAEPMNAQLGRIMKRNERGG